MVKEMCAVKFSGCYKRRKKSEVVAEGRVKEFFKQVTGKKQKHSKMNDAFQCTTIGQLTPVTDNHVFSDRVVQQLERMCRCKGITHFSRVKCISRLGFVFYSEYYSNSRCTNSCIARYCENGLTKYAPLITFLVNRDTEHVYAVCSPFHIRRQAIEGRMAHLVEVEKLPQ